MGQESDELAELQELYPGAKEMSEGGIRYILIPRLQLPDGSEVEALLQPQAGNGGYTTRLYLPAQVPGKGANWTPFRVLEKNWWTWSWNNVPETDRLAQILAQHMNALR